jgi:hypothetical protein
MKLRNWVNVIAAAVFLVAAISAPAQMQMRAPRISGIWAPVVGAGAAYLMESREGKHQMEIAIVGTEMHQGKSGHWLELFMEDRSMGPMVMKQLFVPDQKNIRLVKIVVQAGSEPPMELPVRMMMGQVQETQKADIRDDAERVGTESITVPAGTFTCEHWRSKSGAGDFWVVETVKPYGLVKAVTPDGTMTLQKVIENAKTRIRGTPQKMEIPY